MTDAQKLMAKVIGAHKSYYIHGDDHDRCSGCRWKGSEGDEHDAHVAAEIDKALGGLTRKYGATNDWRNGQVYSVLLGSQGSREGAEARVHDGVDLIGHWVSGWEETE